MNYKLLITGVSGLLGSNLAYYFRKEKHVHGIFHNHPVVIPGVETTSLNLLDNPAVKSFINRLRPGLVIHCAARTDVDRMEEDRDGAWASNVTATEILLDALKDLDAKFIHISTDSVYSGREGNFTEDMPAEPCNWYGKTKLESEKLVSGRPKSLILRTNIYGWNILNKESLAEWFLNRLIYNQKTTGFSDARFSSIYTLVFAEILEKCLKKDLSGLYNCSCRDSWTKYEFGHRLAEIFKLDTRLVVPVKMEECGLKAMRGKDLSLNVERLEKDIGEPLPAMIESLARFHNDWLSGISKQIKSGYTVI